MNIWPVSFYLQLMTTCLIWFEKPDTLMKIHISSNLYINLHYARQQKDKSSRCGPQSNSVLFGGNVWPGHQPPSPTSTSTSSTKVVVHILPIFPVSYSKSSAASSAASNALLHPCLSQTPSHKPTPSQLD